MGILKIGLFFGAIYIVIVTTLYTLQRRILFVPGQVISRPEKVDVPEMEEIKLRTEDGLSLISWYHKSKTGKLTIVYFQGNAGTVADRAYKARILIDHGYGILMVGYRGYGGNPGRPSEDGLNLDANSAIKFLNDQDTPNSKIVLYGESLGTGVATFLASRVKVSGLILEAPYTSITEIAAKRYWFIPVKWLLKDNFNSIQSITSINTSLLIIHGTNDRVINFRQGKILFDSALEPKQFETVKDAGHSDLYDYGADKIILRFLETLSKSG